MDGEGERYGPIQNVSTPTLFERARGFFVPGGVGFIFNIGSTYICRIWSNVRRVAR